MHIRQIEEPDAEAFLDLCQSLDKETRFMLLEAGERTTTIEEEEKIIRGVLSRDNQTIFVVEHSGQLVGYLAALGGRYCRNRHSAHVVIGIRQAFTRQGLGVRLFTELEQWAQRHNIHRLELTVMAPNQAGLSLYRKMGFSIEGTKRDSLLVDGTYVDEYYMAKLI